MALVTIPNELLIRHLRKNKTCIIIPSKPHLGLENCQTIKTREQAFQECNGTTSTIPS